MGVPWDEMYLPGQFASFDDEEDDDRAMIYLSPEERAEAQRAYNVYRSRVFVLIATAPESDR